MASISSDDSFHCHVSKPNRHLSLALGRDNHGTSSSSFSAGPLTPHDDSLLEDDEDFFSLPALKKPDGAVPPHLFSHYRTLSTVPDNPKLASLAETSIATFPSSISSFEIIGTLGRGTYGKVLLGSHARAPGLQAIKVLQKTGMHRYGIEEVERELRTLRSFSDTSADPRTAFLQNMVGTFSDDRFVFIVLEYHPTPLSDSDLSSRLRLGGPVGLPTSKSLPHTFPSSPTSQHAHSALHSLRLLSAELVIAILFLHEMGIIHQDLKPANVMVSATGHIVIGDFGASSWMSEGKVVFRPMDVVTFTPIYAAPELAHRNAEGMVHIDSGVDWWSLGVMLYELALGSVPFQRGGNRTMGDYSCAFGDLEKMVIKGQDTEWWDPRFEDFIRALLIHDPRGRIRDDNVKEQPIFEPVAELWDEIAALAHPPLPAPSLRYLDSDVGLSLYTEEPSDLGRLPFDVPMDEEEDRSLHPLPSSASIYQFCATVSDADDEFSDSPSSLDVSKVVFTPLSDVALAPSPTSSDGDSELGHVVVSPPVVYKRERTPSPTPETHGPMKLPFPSVRDMEGYADVTPPYVYKRAQTLTSTPSPSPRQCRHDIFSPRPDSGRSERVLRRRQGKRQLRKEAGSEWTLEESLTISVLSAMQQKSASKPRSDMSASGSRKSIVGRVCKRLRKFSMRSAA